MHRFTVRGIHTLILPVVLVLAGCSASPRLNEVQFVGSHNSYKQAMNPEHQAALLASNPEAAAALDYAHVPLTRQLDLGIRKLELDVFNVAAPGDFIVGHVQVIDMNSHCSRLRTCLRQISDWSARHRGHVPIWISFNLKDEVVPGLPDPLPFDAGALDRLDVALRAELGAAILAPARNGPGRWPRIDAARGRFLLVLDHVDHKRDLYAARWQERPMFITVPPEHPAAAVMVINDPVAEFDRIQAMVRAGYLVRTRADADTLEARRGDTRRRDRAFASGAQAISTDYYLPARHLGTDYLVDPSFVVRCNPVTAPPGCRVGEPGP